ncbi:MAG: ABC transporter permease, partial [Chloroflexota bacterium]
MNLVESGRVALSALLANKLRAALTMLGIIIGVGAVVTLMSAGDAVEAYITNQFRSIGSNLLFVGPGTFDTQRGGPA